MATKIPTTAGVIPTWVFWVVLGALMVLAAFSGRVHGQSRTQPLLCSTDGETAYGCYVPTPPRAGTVRIWKDKNGTVNISGAVKRVDVNGKVVYEEK